MRKDTRPRRETILVVDDAEEIRRLVSHILLKQGYRVLQAADGVEALQVSAAQQDPIHLVLTDVIMPHMNGAELAERLHRENPAQRLIFMSGYPEDGIVHRIEKLAVFLPKPFTSGALTRMVREVLDAPDGERKDPPLGR